MGNEPLAEKNEAIMMRKKLEIRAPWSVYASV
jgi:hypothetical protein